MDEALHSFSLQMVSGALHARRGGFMHHETGEGLSLNCRHPSENYMGTY